jgi:hypothetical protein
MGGGSATPGRPRGWLSHSPPCVFIILIFNIFFKIFKIF